MIVFISIKELLKISIHNNILNNILQSLRIYTALNSNFKRYLKEDLGHFYFIDFCCWGWFLLFLII